MTLVIAEGDYHSVDRSGFSPEVVGVQEMLIRCDGLTIKFEDERVAVKMAKDILWRLGETFDGKERP